MVQCNPKIWVFRCPNALLKGSNHHIRLRSITNENQMQKHWRMTFNRDTLLAMRPGFDICPFSQITDRNKIHLFMSDLGVSVCRPLCRCIDFIKVTRDNLFPFFPTVLLNSDKTCHKSLLI